VLWNSSSDAVSSNEDDGSEDRRITVHKLTDVMFHLICIV
jgi:hypothetical protein